MNILITESQLNKIVKSIELNESIDNVELSEMHVTDHFVKRKGERYLSNNLEVVLTIPYHGTLNHTVVGTYLIPKEIQDKINDKLNYVTKIKIDPKVTLGIVIHRFNNFKMSEIRWAPKMMGFTSDMLRKHGHRANLYVSDKATNSTGDLLFTIVQDNALITLEYERKHGLETNRKWKYDEIITDMSQLDKYIIK